MLLSPMATVWLRFLTLVWTEPILDSDGFCFFTTSESAFSAATCVLTVLVFSGLGYCSLRWFFISLLETLLIYRLGFVVYYCLCRVLRWSVGSGIGKKTGFVATNLVLSFRHRVLRRSTVYGQPHLLSTSSVSMMAQVLTIF